MRALTTAVALLFASGCGCGNTLTIGDGGQGGGFVGGGSGGSGGFGSTGGGSGIGGSAGTGGGQQCASSCSDDLQSIVDCHGTVTPCPNGQGCGPMVTCIDPCLAAQGSGSTIGCEFYVAAVPPQQDTVGSCYAAFVANTWDTAITLNVDLGGMPLNTSAFAYTPVGSGSNITYQPLAASGMGATLEPGKMAILFLAQQSSSAVFFTPCPVNPAEQSMFQLQGTGLAAPFHFTSTAPVIAYDIYPYGGANSHVTSASLLLPVSAWGTNYVGADPHQGAMLGSENVMPYLQIFASQDNTQVAIQAPVAIVGGAGVAAVAQGAVGHYMLNHNQYLQLQQTAELGGSLIKSDKPIAVWGGIPCMNEPEGQLYCDSAHQQLPAVPLLGSQYAAAQYANRGGGDTPFWRVVGAVDGTTLTFSPPQAGAPATLNAGQTIEFSSTDPNFVLFSQDGDHPFYFSELMSGGGDPPDPLDGIPGGPFQGFGDPDWVNVVPPLQWLRSYLFFTDPTYAKTDLVFIRGQGSDGAFHDVTLDCFGAIAAWTPIGNAPYQVARVDWAMQAGNCSNGVHTATSEAPFGLTVWGTDIDTSYAYPAGMSVKPINTVVVGPMLQ